MTRFVQLVQLLNEKFPPALIEPVKVALVEGFREKGEVLEVAHKVLSVIKKNGHGQNWLCYIRPAVREKCLGYYANPRIDFSFYVQDTDYRVVVVKVCK